MPPGMPGRSSANPATVTLTGCSRSSSRNVSPTASGAQPFGRRRETTTGIGWSGVPASGPVGGALSAAGIGRSTGDPASTASYAGTSIATSVVGVRWRGSSGRLPVRTTEPDATASTPGSAAMSASSGSLVGPAASMR